MFRSIVTALLLTVATPLLAEPVKFAVTDVEGLEALQQEFAGFEAALEEVTGLDVELFPVSSRTSAVEAINQGQVDLVLTGPAEQDELSGLADVVLPDIGHIPDWLTQEGLMPS